MESGGGKEAYFSLAMTFMVLRTMNLQLPERTGGVEGNAGHRTRLHGVVRVGDFALSVLASLLKSVFTPENSSLGDAPDQGGLCVSRLKRVTVNRTKYFNHDFGVLYGRPASDARMLSLMERMRRLLTYVRVIT
jgi:hypothetical protein